MQSKEHVRLLRAREDIPSGKPFDLLTGVSAIATIRLCCAGDNLDQILGGRNGQILILKPANDGRTVVIRSGIRNIYTSGDTSFSMDDAHDTAVLMYHGSYWYLILSISIAGA